MRFVRLFFRFLYKILKLILKTVGILFGLLLLIFLFNYLISERYIFPEPHLFSGKYWYNPYAGMDSLHWQRTNLHMHSRAWGGLTNGSDNSSQEIWKIYRELGYNSIGISNYQNINSLNAGEPWYIPVYEHGYGIFKNHQLVIGARKVLWFDLPFGQNIHQKQYILNRLRKTTDLISINHPAFFGGYPPSDFKFLTGYDLLEVLNGYSNSIPHWDTALSNGKPAFLMADDDMHEISNAREASRRLTEINAPDNKQQSIFAALRAGCAYGVEIKMPKKETYRGKARRLDSLPNVRSVTVRGDSLNIALDKPGTEFRFMGQNGKLLYKQANTCSATYILQPGDTYVRTVILFSTAQQQEGILYYFNPVLRTSDGKRPLMAEAVLDTRSTLVKRIIGFSSVIFVLLNIILLRRRFRRRK